MADGSYFIFGGRDASDDPIPLPGIANTSLVCAKCGCDKFIFQKKEKEDD